MRAVAAQLPIQYMDGMLVIAGSEIIRQKGTHFKDKDGKGIQSEQFYKIPVQNEVNHYRRIKKLFNQKGYDGVREYIDGVVRLHAESIVQHEQVMATTDLAPNIL